MDSTNHIRFKASDRSYFSILKKEIHNIVAAAGFSEKKIGEIDIIVAEMTSNLLKHAGGGDILVRLVDENGDAALELISIDSGKGMSDVAKMEIDGYSTTNTLGHGLGSIKRLSDLSQIYSLKDWGTILLCRIFKEESAARRTRSAAEVRSIVVCKPGEEVCGDGFFYKLDKDRLQIFLGDGLGHGVEANKAVTAAIARFKETNETSPLHVLRDLHVVVKKTRGLVGCIATYSFRDRKWSICGIGNIATRTLVSGMVVKTHMSYNGIIGLSIPNTMKEQVLDGERGQIVMMCSDGIKTRLDLQKYPGIFRYDLSILAAAVFKDFSRETDDMSVVVGRINFN